MTPKLVTEPAGRLWSPNAFSMWLLKQSARWDWDHWDHWATIPNKGQAYYTCSVCNGHVHSDEVFEESLTQETADQFHVPSCESDRFRWEPVKGRRTALSDVGICEGCGLFFWAEGLTLQETPDDDFFWCACCKPEGVE